jgi:HK97 gp10 family phage protein
MGKVTLNPAAIEDKGREVCREAFARLGPQVVDRAAARAPKLTGAGAASIHYEVVEAPDGLAMHVLWDAAHAYMAYSELGDAHQPATPFLRPALDEHYSL